MKKVLICMLVVASLLLSMGAAQAMERADALAQGYAVCDNCDGKPPLDKGFQVYSANWFYVQNQTGQMKFNTTYQGTQYTFTMVGIPNGSLYGSSASQVTTATCISAGRSLYLNWDDVSGSMIATGCLPF